MNILKLLLVCLLLVGCGLSQGISPEIISSTDTPEPPAATMPVFTPTPTTTPAIFNNETIADVERHCVNLQDESLPPAVLNGSLFIMFDFDNEHIFYWDAGTNETYPFIEDDLPPGVRIHSWIQSPNRQWHAYQKEFFDADDNYLRGTYVVIDLKSQIVAEINQDKRAEVLREWFDNERLVIQGSYDFDYGTTIIANPFTQQTEILSPNLPNLYNDHPPAFWSPSYNLDLSKVIYPYGPGKKGYAIMDLQTGNILWRQASDGAAHIPPKWSPDREKFALIVYGKDIFSLEEEREIMVFDGSGEKIIQTNLEANYSKVYFGNDDAIQWSPDKRYIALWLLATNDESKFSDRPSLTVLDLQEKKIIDFCLSGYGTGNEIVWAPDGHSFITWSDENESNILVDVVEKRILRFPAPGRIRFWLRE